MITYKSSLKHLKSSIKNTTLAFDSSNNSPNLSKFNNLIKEATDIENKISFLKKHMDYLIDKGVCRDNPLEHNAPERCDNAREFNNEECHNACKICLENNTCTNINPCNETNNIIRPCNEIRKVKQDNEVIEVNKNDILKGNIRLEIVNELREKCIDIFNNVLKK